VPAGITEEPEPEYSDQSSWQWPGMPGAVAGSAAITGLLAALALRFKSKKDEGAEEGAVARQPTGHEMV